MQNAGEFKFAVVQFLQQPYPSIDEYICIPQSWMKERRVSDRRCLVAYPSENPSLTKKRVKKAENISDKWNLYMAIVKYETNSYEDAYNYIAAIYDPFIENRCLPTTGQRQLPSTTTEVNISPLKRNKQLINHQKRFKVVNDGNLTNRCRYSRKSSESSNNKLTSMTSGPSTDVFSEKLIEVTEGKCSSIQKNSNQNSANNSSICSSSSENTAITQCLPVNYKCIQQDVQATGLLGGCPSKSVITKSPSVKNNTVQHTVNSSNQPFQSFSHLQQNQLLQSHQDCLIQYSHPQGIHGKPKETQVINPGTFSQNIAGNTFHASLNPLILANQIFQNSQQPQGNQISSTYHDHLQRIANNYEIHRRNISNLRSLLPDFSPNQCSQGFGQSTPYTVQNVVNQFSQISNSSSVYQDQAQVLFTPTIPDRQSDFVPSSDSGTMYVPTVLVSTSNLVDQSTVPTQHLDVNQPSVDGDHSQQDPSLQEKIVDGSTEVSCIERSVSSEQCTENESSAIPSSENQSVEALMERLHSDDKVTTDDLSSTQDLDDVNEQSFAEMNLEEEVTRQSPFDQQGQAVDSIANIEDHWLDQMADLFDKINSDFSHTCKMAHELHESLVQSAKTFQCIASLSANLRRLKKSKATVETPKEVTVEVQKVAEKEQVVMGEKGKSDVDIAENKKEDNNDPKRTDDNDESSNNDKSTVDDNDNDKDKDENKDKNKNKSGDKDKDKDKNRDDGDKDEDKDKDEDADKDEKAPKKIRGCIRTFAFPPEYDPKDTKWTLKYRKPDAKRGLVELVEKSRVYINAIKLSHCKRVSKDAKTLARMLLVEIFSQSALSVCSLTGARANAFDINGTNVRPGLDEHARMVILSFVEEHSIQKGWGPFDTQGVINSIRSKIQEVRAKYGQTT